ncbi:MAG: hypothetical protein ABIG29_00125 [Candidatus Nealsonbacteria bacterium]
MRSIKIVSLVLLSLVLFLSSLPMNEVRADNSPVTVTSTISSGTDDIRVYWNGSIWIPGLSKTGLSVGYYSSGLQKSGTGLLFKGLQVPQGVKVISANFTYTAETSYSLGEANSVITGQAADSANTFGTLTDYKARRGTVVGGSSDANLTKARILYNNIGPQTSGTRYASPDIASIIQEIVLRSGWMPGNNIALFWDDHEGLSTDIIYTTRQAAAEEHATYMPITLAVTYVNEPPVAYEQNILPKPLPPTDFKSIGTGATSAIVSWVEGMGATKTLVRYKQGSYPSGVTDGTLAYFETGNTAALTGLAGNAQYYVRAWSYASDGAWRWYSDSPTDLIVTTPPQLTSQEFTIALIPDTQYAVARYPAVYQGMMQWVADNAATQNITAAVGLGDVVDSPSAAQFIDGQAGWDKIKNAGLIYMPTVGNHDYGYGWNTSPWNTYFGQSYFAGKTWYGGAYNGDTANYYIRFNAGEQKFLVLALEFFPRAEILAWAQDIINANADRQVIISTHCYLREDGKPIRHNDSYSTAYYRLDSSRDGQHLLDNFIKKNPNVILVAGGHVTNPPYRSTRVDSTDSGTVTNGLMANWQNYHGGNNGYLALLKFKPGSKEISASFYDTRDGSYTSGYTLYWDSQGAVVSPPPPPPPPPPPSVEDQVYAEFEIWAVAAATKYQKTVEEIKAIIKARL